MKLNKDSIMPLYQQLKNAMKSEINNENIKRGDKILTESELSEQYEVSRITVRKAIDDLVADGYLVKKQGKGTFVNKAKIQRKIEHLLSFSEACIANGMVPSSIVIKKDVIIPDEEDQQILGIKSNEKALYTQRIRLADNEPIMLENNIYSFNKYGFLLNEDLSGSLYNLLSIKYNIKPSGSSNSSVEIVRASSSISKSLHINIGDPLFYMKTCTLDTENNPIHIGKQFIVGERYKFCL